MLSDCENVETEADDALIGKEAELKLEDREGETEDAEKLANELDKVG